MKNIIQLLDIPPNGKMSGVASELVCSLSTTLQKKGYEVTYSRTRFSTEYPVIVFGFWNLFVEDKIPPQLPANAIIFNISPLDAIEQGWFKNYVKYISSYPTIDYSYSNINSLNQLAFDQPRHLFGFGYTEISAFKFPRKRPYYLFFGQVNSERARKISAIKSSGIPLIVLSDTWGNERDLQIATAKAVINIPKFDRNILEVYRIWHTLCLGTSVVTESGFDKQLSEDYSRYISTVESIDQLEHLDDFLIDPEIYRLNTSFENSVMEMLKFINHL